MLKWSTCASGAQTECRTKKHQKHTWACRSACALASRARVRVSMWSACEACCVSSNVLSSTSCRHHAASACAIATVRCSPARSSVSTDRISGTSDRPWTPRAQASPSIKRLPQAPVSTQGQRKLCLQLPRGLEDGVRLLQRSRRRARTLCQRGQVAAGRRHWAQLQLRRRQPGQQLATRSRSGVICASSCTRCSTEGPRSCCTRVATSNRRSAAFLRTSTASNSLLSSGVVPGTTRSCTCLRANSNALAAAPIALAAPPKPPMPPSSSTLTPRSSYSVRDSASSSSALALASPTGLAPPLGRRATRLCCSACNRARTAGGRQSSSSCCAVRSASDVVAVRRESPSREQEQ